MCVYECVCTHPHSWLREMGISAFPVFLLLSVGGEKLVSWVRDWNPPADVY